jgi:Formate/nitrite family of transporters
MANYYSPKEVAVIFKDTGLYKAGLPVSKFAVLAILGGAFIALGGLLAVIVAGGSPGIGEANPGLIKFIAGALFPVGLIMVSVSGADLFTSDCTAMTLPWLQKETGCKHFIKILSLSFFFNFIGTQIIAIFLTDYVHLIYGHTQAYLHDYVNHKMHQDFMTVALKGIGANWLVCMGMWLGYSAKDLIGKSVGIWIPVMMFVTLGFEHSIANMFFIPTAIYTGADITWGEFLIKNLLPATIGNVIGGVVFVGCAFWYTQMKGQREN